MATDYFTLRELDIGTTGARSSTSRSARCHADVEAASFWACKAGFQQTLEPSMSVKRKVMVPLGSPPAELMTAMLERPGARF